MPKNLLSQPETYEYMRPIVEGWRGKIESAVDERSGFDAVADQCWYFYNGAQGFMYEREFQSKYIGGSYSPKFKMTLNKAFEYVALYGPFLYWQNPVRTVRPRDRMEIDPQDLVLPNDPQSMQLAQLMAQDRMQVQRADKIVSTLMGKYLNYTAHEQPHGGLADQSELAITEALLTGQGVIWPGPFRFPGSSRTLTQCVFDSQENLVMDPDCTCEADAYWIAKRCIKPYWEWEREFKLPKDSLRHAASRESRNTQGGLRSNRMAKYFRATGKSNDLLVVWKIWSKMGVGTRLADVTSGLGNAFDRAVGDHAYLAIADNVDYPLNAPSQLVRRMSDEAVADLFAWPIPYWKDDRWPFARLQFYRHPRSWLPISPLGPGLGELAYMNVFMSHLANRIWSSSRDFIAVMESARKFLEPALKSGSDQVLLFVPQIHQDIDKVVKFVQQPQTNVDAWRILDLISKSFEMRVGLNELWYGMANKQSRTATDVEAKTETMRIRPDYMAKKVENWQGQIADMEKFAAYYFVEQQDVTDLFGRVGSSLWSHYITGEDEETMLREVRATVEAGTARKRNKQQDAQNINTVLNVLFPEFSKHADLTTDTSQINALIEKWGDAIDMDVDDLKMGERVPKQPEPTPEQQQMAQLEMQQQAAEIEKKRADAYKAMADAALKYQQADASENEAESAEQQLEQDEEKHTQELEQLAEKFDLNREFDVLKHMQELDQDAEKHEQEMRQKRQEQRLAAAASSQE